jgi:hypothetical protein
VTAQNTVDTSFPQTKFGQAGMKFLEIGLSPAAEGLGGAATALDLGAASMFYNPAGLANPVGSHGDAFVAQTQWVADVTINAAAASYVTPWVTVGVSFMSVDYGDVPGYRMSADGGVESTGNIDLASSAVGFGVAKQVTDKFSIGVTARLVSEDLGSIEGSKESVMSWDAGTLYRTGWGNSVLSMSIRNYSREAKHQDDGYDLPMIFRIGIAMDVMQTFAPMDNQALMVSIDALHPRDRAEEAIVGLEYGFMDMLYLRAASRLGHDYTGASADTGTTVSLASAGLGVKYGISGYSVGVDYSWSNQGDLLGSVNRFGVSVGF